MLRHRVRHSPDGVAVNAEELEAQLAEALAAYDAEVVGRREEVTRLHGEMGKLRAQLAVARVELTRYREQSRSACAKEMRDQVEHQGACNTCEDDLERWAFSFEAIQCMRSEAEAQLAEARALLDEVASTSIPEFQIRFDGPPGPESGRFVECETLAGKGINVGRWQQDGEYWLLVITANPESPRAECVSCGVKMADGNVCKACVEALEESPRAAAERAVLDPDILAKRLCDLALESGWVLKYKLARRAVKPFTTEPDTGQPTGDQPDGSYVIAPGRIFPGFKLEQEMAKLGLHHVGESSVDVAARAEPPSGAEKLSVDEDPLLGDMWGDVL